MNRPRFKNSSAPPPCGEVEKSEGFFGWGQWRFTVAPTRNAARFDLPTGGRCRRALIALSLLFFASTAAFAAAPVKILMIGTSLTQGYGLPPGTEIPVVLEAKLKAAGVNATVINAGVSGDTSAGGVARIDWSLADRPNAVIVELGSNDALRGIDPAQTEKNLSAILAKLKAAHLPVLLLGMQAPRNLGPEYAAQFDPIYPRLAKQHGALLYPFVLDGVALNAKLNQADGIHPNPAGVKIVVDRMFPDVMKLVAEVGH
jgi:acyl-CoA thioesterase-1